MLPYLPTAQIQQLSAYSRYYINTSIHSPSLPPTLSWLSSSKKMLHSLHWSGCSAASALEVLTQAKLANRKRTEEVIQKGPVISKSALTEQQPCHGKERLKMVTLFKLWIFLLMQGHCAFCEGKVWKETVWCIIKVGAWNTEHFKRLGLHYSDLTI